MTAGVQRSDRFAVLWGGGLGDVLVLRPLLLGAAARLDHKPHFFTTANHLEGLFETLGLDVELHVLPRSPMAALAVFRRLGLRFDWMYLGPAPRIKTRMLAHVVGAERIWSRHHAGAGPFLGDQIVADVRALGLAEDPRATQPYGGGWGPQGSADGDCLVLHAGTKGQWQTKQWPAQKWSELMAQLLAATPLSLLLVGTPGEKAQLDALADGKGGRVQVRTDLTLPELAGRLRGSRGLICHNSGVMHLATLLGKPTLVLTGSSPQRWRPPYAHVLNLDSGRCGLACDQYRCPVPFYRARCIRELEVQAVVDAAHRLFGL